MTDLTTATPIEIDTALAAIYERFYTQQSKVRHAQTDLEYARKRLARVGGAGPATAYVQQAVQDAATRLEAALGAADAILAECDPYDAEYATRPWTRAWKVERGNGHIHTSMRCHTCYVTTEFGWLPQVSGMPEAEIVALSGSAACTVCYPTAPVDVLSRPCRLFTGDEVAAQAERDERAAAKIARDAAKAAKAVTADGSELVVKINGRREYIKTLVTAKRLLTDAFGYYAKDLESEDYPTLIAAIAAKEGKDKETVIEEARKRAAKRDR